MWPWGITPELRPQPARPREVIVPGLFHGKSFRGSLSDQRKAEVCRGWDSPQYAAAFRPHPQPEGPSKPHTPPLACASSGSSILIWRRGLRLNSFSLAACDRLSYARLTERKRPANVPRDGSISYYEIIDNPCYDWAASGHPAILKSLYHQNL